MFGRRGWTVLAVMLSIPGFAQSLGANEAWTSSPFFGTAGTYVADVTGDGKADVLKVTAPNVTLRVSNGSTFLTTEYAWLTTLAWERGFQFADINGDGKADIYAINNNSIKVWWGFGTTVFSSTPYTLLTGVGYGSDGTWFRDVNGDGAADLIMKNGSTITCRVMNKATLLLGGTTTLTTNATGIKPVFGDFNGDTKLDYVDFVYVTVGYYSVRYHKFNTSTGAFDAPVTQTIAVGDIYSSGGLTHDIDFKPYGVRRNGDVYEDLIINYIHTTFGHTDMLAGSSSGTIVFPTLTTISTSPMLGDIATLFADATGDGNADGIVSNSTSFVVLRR